MASKYWIKLYHEILDDPKMGRMPDKLWRRTIELFLLAGDINQDGLLPSIQDMAWRLRISVDKLSKELKQLITFNIIQKNSEKYIVTKFAERQAPLSDTERQRLHRDNERKAKYYGHPVVTKRDSNESRNNHDSLVDIDKETEKDTEIDVDKELDIEIDIETNKFNSLFEQCQRIYETKKGQLVTDGPAFSSMIGNFITNGVTAEDYSAAIDAMDADKKYKGTKPTSYETWTISNAEKRKNPSKTNLNRTPRTPEEIAAWNERVLNELADEY